jgi:hypothetical protein
MKSTEDGRRYNAAHVLDGAMDIHTHETGSTAFQCLTLQLLWSRDLRASCSDMACASLFPIDVVKPKGSAAAFFRTRLVGKYYCHYAALNGRKSVLGQFDCGRCVCRKLDSAILVMKSAEDRL